MHEWENLIFFSWVRCSLVGELLIRVAVWIRKFVIAVTINFESWAAEMNSFRAYTYYIIGRRCTKSSCKKFLGTLVNFGVSADDMNRMKSMWIAWQKYSVFLAFSSSINCVIQTQSIKVKIAFNLIAPLVIWNWLMSILHLNNYLYKKWIKLQRKKV